MTWKDFPEHPCTAKGPVLVLIVADMGFGMKMVRPDVMSWDDDGQGWGYVTPRRDVATSKVTMGLTEKETVVQWMEFPHPSSPKGLSRLPIESTPVDELIKP